MAASRSPASAGNRVIERAWAARFAKFRADALSSSSAAPISTPLAILSLGMLLERCQRQARQRFSAPDPYVEALYRLALAGSDGVSSVIAIASLPMAVGFAVRTMVHNNALGTEINVNQSRRKFVGLSILTAVSVIPGRLVHGLDPKRPDRFLPEERRAIEDYYRRINDKKKPNKGLPPGLAKRGGNLPPGLQKKLERDGQLPPGLQKRMEPLPVDLDRRLPRLPENWQRVVVERDVILLDRRTNRILDVIENVIDIVTGQ
jgi:hypothetical protein